jgi:hypothetical protein
MRVSYAMVTLSFLAALACGQHPSQSEPKAPVAPITITGDLQNIDVCSAIPREDIEAAMGRKLVGAPQHFEYYDAPGASGCWYDAGKDASKEAHFGYVVFTSVEIYNSQPLYKNVAVNGIGVSAYFNNGADARQLWVKVADRVAFVVAFGDVPNEEGAKAIAKLVLAAIK